MRTLNLNKLNLGEEKLLHREQLKTIYGGKIQKAECPPNECTTNSDCTEGKSCINFNYSESCKDEPTTIRYICI